MKSARTYAIIILVASILCSSLAHALEPTTPMISKSKLPSVELTCADKVHDWGERQNIFKVRSVWVSHRGAIASCSGMLKDRCNRGRAYKVVSRDGSTSKEIRAQGICNLLGIAATSGKDVEMFFKIESESDYEWIVIDEISLRSE